MSHKTVQKHSSNPESKQQKLAAKKLRANTVASAATSTTKPTEEVAKGKANAPQRSEKGREKSPSIPPSSDADASVGVTPVKGAVPKARTGRARKQKTVSSSQSEACVDALPLPIEPSAANPKSSSVTMPSVSQKKPQSPPEVKRQLSSDKTVSAAGLRRVVLNNLPEVSQVLGQIPMNRVVLNDLPEVSQVLGEVPRNTAILNDLPKVSQVLGEVPLKDDPTSSDPGRLSPGIANSPQASPRDSKGECIAFILGHCPRGDLCPYPHIPPGPAECRPFKAGLCYRYNCPLQHVPLREICLKYQRGECTWGKRCRRLHTLEEVTDRAEPPKAKNAETKTSQFSCDAGRAITKEQMAAFKNTEHQMHLDVKSSAAINLQEEYVKISEDIRDPRSLILRVAHDSDGKPVCKNFLLDRCKLGMQCHRSHPPRHEWGKYLPRSDDICGKYLEGRCFLGENCPNKHPPEVSTQQKQPSVANSLGVLAPSNKTQLPSVSESTKTERSARTGSSLRTDSENYPNTTRKAIDPSAAELRANASSLESLPFTQTVSPPLSHTQRPKMQTGSATSSSQISALFSAGIPSQRDMIHSHSPVTVMPGRCIDFVYGDAERDLHEARQKENLGAQPALNSNAGNTLRTHSSSATTPQATPVVPPGLGLEKSLSSSGGTSEGHATITIPLLDSVSVTLGPGFAVSEVVTGFESKTVIIKNIPSNVTSKKLRKTLESFGELKNLQIPDNRSSPGHTIIKATFTSHSHAENASKSLDGTKLFGTRITARLASQKATSLGKGVVRDGDVYLEFPAPCRTACIGFATLESAQHAIELANDAEMGQSILSAFLYRGAPTIATYNVKILGLPPDTTAQELIGFGDNEGIMLMKSNYQSLDNALKELQASLERYGELDALVVYSPPFMNQTVRAWAHFSSPAAADEACKILNNCRQPYFDHEPMHAEHVLSIQYRLPPHVFAVLRDNIRYLRACVHDPTNRCDITIRGGRIHDTGAVGVKLTAETLSNLTRLKSSFESILRGETVMMNNRIAWNSFFASASGALFVADLQARSYGVLIDVDLRRSRIRLYGSPHKLVRVRQAICGKIAGLDAQKLHTFPLDGNLVGYFINTDLLKLQQELGAENVYIDHLSLKIRGNQDALKVARLIIQHARQNRLLRRKHITNGCPVCLDEVSLPVTLDCGHTWCKQCLTDYLLAAVETKAFPLKCLGNEARCTEKVPLRIARTILSPEDFHNVAQASFLAYIHSRPTEFHYCPTPDCSQIYRTAPPGTALQCPSCLVRICTNCHSEYHEGTPCADGETEQGKLFDEWTSTRDVKKCPGCKTYIERDAGCNHMTCTRCRTHICWVCLQTFPQGDIVYDHMREAHGGIGL